MKERPIIFSGEMVKAILEGRKTMTRRVVKCKPGYSPFVGEMPEYPRKGFWQAKSAFVHSDLPLVCPYGAPGDRLWLKEAFSSSSYDGPGCGRMYGFIYKADDPTGSYPSPERPIHTLGLSQDAIAQRWDKYNTGHYDRWVRPQSMPRWASRITLEVASVKVERLQDISIMDALREGVSCQDCGYTSIDAGVHMDHALCVNRWLAESKVSDAGYHGAIAAFRELWDSLNAKKPGCSWADNPWVFVIEFKPVEGLK